MDPHHPSLQLTAIFGCIEIQVELCLAAVQHVYFVRVCLQSRDSAFQSKAVSEMAALRREQARLERETGQRLFYGLSLVETVRTAIR